jgi:hypothetical protein
MSYQWDIFFSYPRRDPVGPWVQDHLFPTLEKWLKAAMTAPPRLFLDKQMEVGTRWPSNLQSSLLRSRCMVAVWAPPYFGSPWCLAEWKSMRQRELQLGLGTGAKAGLIYPIRFFDGETFPREARTTQDQDYTRFNSFPPGRATLRSRAYRDFDARLQAVASVLARWIAKAPNWRGNWPALRPPVSREAASPRLSFNHVRLR